uniref:Rab3 GTPase-activating protein catalytic subunit n=1 Tax=Macrostomum lignano TaxID=282301 RepID=A0A1I8GYB3_9PLAT
KVRGNPDDDPADGEVNDKFGRFLEFVLRHRSVLSNSDHLRRLTIWHAAVAKQIDGQLSMEEFEAWRVEDFLKSPDRLPALSADKLDHLSAMFASHTANRDLQIDWGLLETAVFREVLADKCFVRLLPWEPRLASAEQRSLSQMIEAFRANCPESDSKSARLTDAEQRFVRRRQQQDTAYARRLADFCRLALSYAHRCLAEENCSIGDASLAEFLNSAASDGAIPIRSSWPPLPGVNSQASGESLSSSTMSLSDPTPLRRLVALLEAAEAELYSVVLPDLRRKRSNSQETSDASTARRLVELLPEDARLEALSWLRLTCLRHVAKSSSNASISAAEALREPANRPTGTRPDCLDNLLAEIGAAPLALLLPLCDELEKILANGSMMQ